MVEAILKDKKKILPCAVYLEGEYGIKGLCVGVPVEVEIARGAEEIVQIKLTPDENAALQKSAASVKELVTVLGIYKRIYNGFGYPERAPIWRPLLCLPSTRTRTSCPRGPNLRNRRMRTRIDGGVAGEGGRPLPPMPIDRGNYKPKNFSAPATETKLE